MSPVRVCPACAKCAPRVIFVARFVHYTSEVTAFPVSRLRQRFMICLLSAFISTAHSNAHATTATLSAPTPTLRPLEQFAVQSGSAVSNIMALAGEQRLLCQNQQTILLPNKLSQSPQAISTGDCRVWSLSADHKWLAIWRPRLKEIHFWLLSDTEPARKQKFKLRQLKGMGFVAGRLWVLTNTKLLSVRPDTAESSPVTLGASEADKDDADSNSTSASNTLPNALFISANGAQAVVQRDQKIQLISLPDFEVQSVAICENSCKLTRVHFSQNGKRAIVATDNKLYGLRVNYPSSIIVRNSQNVRGFLLHDNTVLSLEKGKANIRDFQTGRKERLLKGDFPSPLTIQSGTDTDALIFVHDGQLIQQDVRNGKKKVRLFTGPVWRAGLDAKAQPLILQRNGLLMIGDQFRTGEYQDLYSQNRLNWLLSKNSSSTLQVLQEGVLRLLPSQIGLKRLHVNHWGTSAVLWDSQRLSVISLEKRKEIVNHEFQVNTFQNAELYLSPDATRVYVFPKTASAYILSIPELERTPLTDQIIGGSMAQEIQLNNLGVTAVLFKSRTVRTGTTQTTQGRLSLYGPKTKVPYFTLAGVGRGSRFSQDGLFLAVPVQDISGIRVKVLEVRSGKVKMMTPPLATWPSLLSWSADRKRLLVGTGLRGSMASMTIFEVP